MVRLPMLLLDVALRVMQRTLLQLACVMTTATDCSKGDTGFAVHCALIGSKCKHLLGEVGYLRTF